MNGKIVWTERDGALTGKIQNRPTGGYYQYSHLTLRITYDRGRPDNLVVFDPTSSKGWVPIGYVQYWDKDRAHYCHYESLPEAIEMLKRQAELLYLND